MSFKTGIFLFVLAAGFYSCGKQTAEGEALARVYGKDLKPEDIEASLPRGLSKKDSIAFVNNLIEEWVNKEIRLNKAEKHLANTVNLQKQVDDYRNSLLVYEYENRLIKERLDTSVQDEDIIHYYEANKENFVLQRNVLRLNFVKILNQQPGLKEFRKLMQSTRADDRQKLALICSRQAANWYLDDAVWLDFQDIIKEIPIKTYDEEQFLSNNKYIEIKEGDYIYLVKILDYRVRNSNSSLEFEKESIRQILLNRRKSELLQKMQADTRKEAELEKQVEIFVK